jgi:ketosteroid isomerase-like protein
VRRFKARERFGYRIRVQLYNGNVAILTYNYVGVTQDKDGKTEPIRAKSTRVYVKKDNKWTLVHANFGGGSHYQNNKTLKI